MNYLAKITTNPIINAVFIAWFIAQFLKVIIVLITDKKIDFSRFVGAGGMPSSHSSTVCALAVCIGRVHGVASTEFAICVVFSLVVMYDATGVRRAAGQQAAILNKMINNWHTEEDDFLEIKLKELLGHTPVQVIFGSVIGIIVGLLYNLQLYN